MAQKKGRYSTCSQRKCNEKKTIEAVYTAINSKLMNIVRVQTIQGTEREPKVKEDKIICDPK